MLRIHSFQINYMPYKVITYPKDHKRNKIFLNILIDNKIILY